jgi:hypothetical protein
VGTQVHTLSNKFYIFLDYVFLQRLLFCEEGIFRNLWGAQERQGVRKETLIFQCTYKFTIKFFTFWYLTESHIYIPRLDPLR